MNFKQWLETETAPQIRNKKILVLMRGLPGAGKSYTAKQVLYRLGGGEPHGHIFSIDDEFMPDALRKRLAGIEVSPEEEDAEYKKNFSVRRRPAMVRKMIERFKAAVDQGITPIIVDNTNIKIEHMRGFADYAEKEGYEVRIQYPESEHWKTHKDALRTKDPEAMKAFAQALKQFGRHNVPEETLLQMMKTWDFQPPMAGKEGILGRDPTPKREAMDYDQRYADEYLKNSGVRRTLEDIIKKSFPTGMIKTFVDMKGMTDKDKSKLSAYRVVAEEIGFPIGQWKINYATGVATARFV
jgi:predicted kinase